MYNTMEQVNKARISPYNGRLEVNPVGVIGWFPVAPGSLNVPESYILERANNPAASCQWLGYDRERQTLHLITDL